MNNKKNILYPTGYCIEGEVLWFLQRNLNKVVNYSLKTNQICNVIELFLTPSRRYDDWYNDRIIHIDGKLYIFVSCANFLQVYDIQQDVLNKFDFPNGLTMDYHSILVHDRHIYAFPYGNEIGLKISLNGEIEELNIYGEKKPYYQRWCVEYENEVLWPDTVNGGYFKFDFLTSNIVSCEIENVDSPISAIAEIDKFYVMPYVKENKILICDTSNYSIEIIDYPEGYKANANYRYINIYEYNGKVYLFPLTANMIVEIDPQKKTAVQVFCDVDLSSIYYDCIFYEGNILAYEMKKQNFRIFNLNNFSVEELPIVIDTNFEEKLCDLKSVLNQPGKVWIEGMGLNLETFILNLV